VLVGTDEVAVSARRLLHLRRDRVRVVPLAASPAFAVGPHVLAGRRKEARLLTDRLGLGERYLVYPGRYDVRHDAPTLMAALTRLARSDRPADLAVDAPWPPRVLVMDATPDDRAALARVGLEHLAARPLAQTSYGERRRVEIAMALAQEPHVLLLDEPFAGLSIEERRDVLRLVTAIPRDVTIVMIEHDMDVALDFAERITVLHFGQVVVEGTRSEVVAHPRTREIYLGE